MPSVQNNPPNTFRTRLGNDNNRAAMMIGAINSHAWFPWTHPGADYPYQPGSGYGDMNDAIVPAPPGQYLTYQSLNRVGTTAQQAQRESRLGPFWYALKKWWSGKEA